MRVFGPGRDVALALTLLTALPLPVRWPVREQGKGPGPDVASWFAFVGLVLGAPLGVVLWLSWRYLYGVSFTFAALVLLSVALFTRFMHWDGLADVADAWFVPSERRAEVLADSHVGAFGATAIALFALLQWSALTQLGTSRASIALFVLAPVAGRLAASCAAWFGTPARDSGLGHSVMRRPSTLGVLATVLAIGGAAGVAVVLGASLLSVAIVGVVGLLLALGVPHLISARFGGVSGDVMGASVLVVETATMVASLGILGALRLAGVAA